MTPLKIYLDEDIIERIDSLRGLYQIKRTTMIRWLLKPILTDRRLLDQVLQIYRKEMLDTLGVLRGDKDKL